VGRPSRQKVESLTSVGSTSVGQTVSLRGASPSDRTRRERGALPGGFRIALDHEAVIGGDGSTIRGGSPVRLLRLTAAGARILSEVARGAAVAEIETRQPGASRLLRRLVDAGLAHPNPPESPCEAAVQVIIPVRNRVEP
jgi:mycofactocin glycosyltransferase